MRLSRGAGQEAFNGGRGGAGPVITRDEHGGGRAAAAGPGTRPGVTGVLAGRGSFSVPPAGDTRKHDSVLK